MKKRTFFCIIPLMIIGGITRCHNTDKVISNKNIDTQKVEKIETREKVNDRDKDEISQLPEKENNLNNTTENDEEKIYNLDEYGTVEEKQQEFFKDEIGDMSYYYKMEKFFFNDSFLNAVSINHTLQQIYDEYEKNYIETATLHSVEESSNIPYSYWHILALKYVGDDYVSILYNDIYYMGGAHPYSCLNGITIDCKTGEQILASQLLEKSDEEILTEVSNAMGLANISTWDEVDFYLTDSTIVFFYRMPGFWEDLVLYREK